MGATPIFQGVQSEGSGAYVRSYKQSVELDTGQTWPQRECYSSQRPQGRQRLESGLSHWGGGMSGRR